MLSDDNQRKVKEKTSWLNLARARILATSGNKRHAVWLRKPRLDAFLQEAILFQSVYLHLLYHTDIRPADQSLLFRKDCLGIHCSEDQRWSATRSTEPLYFAFPSTDILNAWTALLRSYAAPEIYGISSSQRGGSYRIWRQVEVTCVQGLNLGVHRPLDPTPNTNTSTDTEGHGDAEAVDLDLFCEVYVNSVLSGRTVVKKSVGSPDWHEIFTFTDLPPFERLAVVVWREKKLQKPSIIGTVYITLTNFRRGEHVEGWFPVLSGGSTAPSTQVGKLRLKIRVDEEIVLPYSEYSKVIDTLDRRNYLEWMSDLDDVLLINVFEMADREVDGTPSSHHTLFRGNTVLTKTIESLMGWYGKGFLEASVGQTIRRLCLEGVAIEVDPARHSKAKGPKDIEKNVDLLVHWCREIWDQIFSVRMQCPDEMRQLFEYIRELVERRYRTGYNKTRTTSYRGKVYPLSAFFVLLYLLSSIHTSLVYVQRSLTLIAKVIQSLANLNAAAPKEDFMRGVMSFVEEKLPEMLDYILVVSTPGPKETPQPQSEEAQDRYRAIKALQERKQAMYDLQREAIPPLPHFLDIPRHLAIVTSSIVRSARSLPVPQDPDLADLYERCRDVEQQALYYALSSPISRRPQQLQCHRGRATFAAFKTPEIVLVSIEFASEDRAVGRHV
ncbi:Rho GTPase activation protein [Gloeopeniophorella convolvens]|nr:Rho GTPase activation protein [Gloeopeniophorella convolvens]